MTVCEAARIVDVSLGKPGRSPNTYIQSPAARPRLLRYCDSLQPSRCEWSRSPLATGGSGGRAQRPARHSADTSRRWTDSQRLWTRACLESRIAQRQPLLDKEAKTKKFGALSMRFLQEFAGLRRAIQFEQRIPMDTDNLRPTHRSREASRGQRRMNLPVPDRASATRAMQDSPRCIHTQRNAVERT